MPTKTKRRRSKKSSRKSPPRQSKKPPRRRSFLRASLWIAYIVLFVICGMAIWGEFQIQQFLVARHEGNFRVLGVKDKIASGHTITLPLLTNTTSTVAIPKKLSAFPPHIIQAVLAIEDRRFFEHFGIDAKAISRAIISNLSAGAIVQGASTLTQQLAKNLFLSPKRTFLRKFQELFIALLLEIHLSKQELLTLYLNEVYLGQEGRTPLLGVGAASQSFFRKNIKQLSIDEAALLAGLIRAPSIYNPRRHPERAQKRRNVVLQAMRDTGHITAKKAKQLSQKPIRVTPPLFSKRYAPFFEVALRRSLSKSVHLDAVRSQAGVIMTGLSQELQSCAEVAVQGQLHSLEKRFPRLHSKTHQLEAALVALDPTSGAVRAWVGGRDYTKNQFDHVQQAQRPIGSTVKPFIYLTALDPALNSYRTATLRSILPDEPISVALPNGTRWEPSNADKQFRGNVTLRYALEKSLNLPPIHVTRRVGIDAVQHTLQAFHVHPNPPKVLALALGAVETNLLSLTAAYGALANEGRYIPPRIFDRIESSSGEMLYRARHQEIPVADPGAVFLLSDVLHGVITRGTGKRALPSTPLAYVGGKTGTSQDARDAWFIGYTPRLVAGVWLGFDDNRPIRLGGGTAAAPIWKQFIECSAPYIENPSPIPPPNVIRTTIDSATGELFTSSCPDSQRVSEIFLRGAEPTEPCALHEGVVSSHGRTQKKSLAPHRRKNDKKGFFGRLFGM